MYGNKKRSKIELEYRPIGEIKPSKNNTRLHDPDQIDRIARSIESIGWTKPIITDEKGEILAGHGAHMAALQLGEEQVPVVVRRGLTAAEKRAYRIADNKLAERSEWDDKALAREFADLSAAGFDMALTGFDQTDIDFILQPAPTAPTDPAMPPLQANPTSKLGDVWVMGEHRLICGDSTKAATLKTLMHGRQAQCVFTDPPYGVSYGANTDTGHDIIKGDDKRRAGLKEMIKSALAQALKHTREDAGWYIWHASSTRDDFSSAMRDVGLVELQMLIWEKPGGVMGWSDYRWAHEPCFYAARQGIKPVFHGDRTNTTVWRLQHLPPADQALSIGNGVLISAETGQELYITTVPPKGKKVRHMHTGEDPILLQAQDAGDDVWRVSRDTGHSKEGTIHPTMKPVELVRRALENSTRPGEIVLDMFSGSMSTIMGAEQTGRIGYAVELDPRYVDAGVQRWQNATGQEAVHAEEGITFAAATKARQ